MTARTLPRGRGAPFAAVLAVTFATVLLVRVLGVSDTASVLAYLGPAALMFVSLWLGHYPGERLLVSCARRRERRRAAALVPLRLATPRLPRGGDLLATALAGRAPPVKCRIAPVSS